MKRTIYVTSSMVRTFKTCRRRYHYEYVDCIKPVSAPRALAFGSLYHAGLEALLGGADLETAIATIQNTYLADCTTRAIEDDGAGLVVSECIRAFDRDVPWRSWKIEAVEKEFSVNCGYARYLKGKVDCIITLDGGRYLIEHKTASCITEKYLHHLLWDEQAGNYLFAANRLGLDVQGVFYVVCGKPTLKRATATAADRLEYKKDGTLYARCRLTDESNEEYAARVAEWYKLQNRFVVQSVYRTPEQLQILNEDLLRTMRDMAVCERQTAFYRNPEACRNLPCPYEALCLEDSPELRASNFVFKPSINEELTEDVSL